MTFNNFFGSLIALGFTIYGAGCASTTPTTGDETHFQNCTVDRDCDGTSRCEAGKCQPSTKDAGGSGGNSTTGSGGAPGSTGGASAASGGTASLCAALNATSGDVDASAVQSFLGDKAASCVLRASNYDRRCTKDADCTLIGEGNGCEAPCVVQCTNAAISQSAYAKYQADYAATPFASCGPTFCGCPAAGTPVCSGGLCELQPIGIAASTDGGFDSGSVHPDHSPHQ